MNFLRRLLFLLPFVTLEAQPHLCEPVPDTPKDNLAWKGLSARKAVHAGQLCLDGRTGPALRDWLLENGVISRSQRYADPAQLLASGAMLKPLVMFMRRKIMDSMPAVLDPCLGLPFSCISQYQSACDYSAQKKLTVITENNLTGKGCRFIVADQEEGMAVLKSQKGNVDIGSVKITERYDDGYYSGTKDRAVSAVVSAARIL